MRSTTFAKILSAQSSLESALLEHDQLVRAVLISEAMATLKEVTAVQHQPPYLVDVEYADPETLF